MLAFRNPPVDSMGELTNSGDGLLSVPLKSICSAKCATPCWPFRSFLEPVFTEIRIETDSEPGSCWDITLNPDSNIDF